MLTLPDQLIQHLYICSTLSIRFYTLPSPLPPNHIVAPPSLKVHSFDQSRREWNGSSTYCLRRAIVQQIQYLFNNEAAQTINCPLILVE